MKYILLIYQNPATFETFSEEERNRVMVDVDEIMQELTQSGEWVGGEGLADPSNTKTVRVRDGVPAVTDGPFVESKEIVGGYAIMDAKSREEALALARRFMELHLKHWPTFEGESEVRPFEEEAQPAS